MIDPRSTSHLASCSLIVGCGHLGRSLALKLKQAGVRRVFATTTREERFAQLAALGCEPMLVSVTQPVTLASIEPALEADALDVFYFVPPGRPRADPSPEEVVRRGVAHAVRALGRGRLRSAVMASSTAVYGQSDGAAVSAESPAEPSHERGRLLLDGERLWLAGGDAFRVVRLAGLYGPGRVIGAQAVREGSPLVGDPDAKLNLIHVEDAASLFLRVAEAVDKAAPVELGADGAPPARVEYYRELARRLGVPPPDVMPETAAAAMGVNLERLRRSGNKACDPASTRKRLNWRPAYPTFREGLDHALQDMLGTA